LFYFGENGRKVEISQEQYLQMSLSEQMRVIIVISASAAMFGSSAIYYYLQENGQRVEISFE